MLCLPTAGLLAQGQYDLDPLPPFPDHVQYTHYGDQIGKALSPHWSLPALPCHQGLAPQMCKGSARDPVGLGDGNQGGVEEVAPGSAGTSSAPGAGSQLAPHQLRIHLCLQTPRTTMITKVKGGSCIGWADTWAGGWHVGQGRKTPYHVLCRGHASALGGAVPVPVSAASPAGSHPSPHLW